MKNKILIFTIFVSILLVFTPCISAVEKQVKEECNLFPNIDFGKLSTVSSNVIPDEIIDLLIMILRVIGALVGVNNMIMVIVLWIIILPFLAVYYLIQILSTMLPFLLILLPVLAIVLGALFAVNEFLTLAPLLRFINGIIWRLEDYKNDEPPE